MRWAIIVATAVQAAGVIALQFTGILLLQPEEFGRFSAIYLCSALSSSFLLSVVCEAWLRRTPHAHWSDYSAPLVWISLTGGMFTAIVFALLPGFISVAIAGSPAVALSTYRTGARYYSLHAREYAKVIQGDAAFLTTLLVFLAIWLTSQNSLTPASLSTGWSLGAFSSVLLSRKPDGSFGLGKIRYWWRLHSSEIRPLLIDSLLLDAAGIGTPYVLAPLLGLRDFGIYRALSNLSSPVKLVLFPLRPIFFAKPPKWFLRHRVSAVIVGGSLLFGVATYGALSAARRATVGLGTLDAISSHGTIAAIFVSATLANGAYYLIGRAHLPGRILLYCRLATAIGGILLPVGGAVVEGLPGALFGVTTSVVLGAAVWALCLYRRFGSVATLTGTGRKGV